LSLESAGALGLLDDLHQIPPSMPETERPAAASWRASLQRPFSPPRKRGSPPVRPPPSLRSSGRSRQSRDPLSPSWADGDVLTSRIPSSMPLKSASSISACQWPPGATVHEARDCFLQSFAILVRSSPSPCATEIQRSLHQRQARSSLSTCPISISTCVTRGRSHAAFLFPAFWPDRSWTFCSFDWPRISRSRRAFSARPPLP